MTTDNPLVGMHPGASAANKSDVAQSPAVSLPNSSNASEADESDTSRFTGMPERKNIRAVFHDYSGGDYFVTICTNGKKHYFGEIRNGEMVFSEIGDVADKCLAGLAAHYRYVEVPIFVVMPNHVHAIIRISEPADAPGCIPTKRTALSVVVGGYKQAVTMYARRNNMEFGWQKRFHDHIIREIHDGNRIADYVRNNVVRWDSDCFNDSH